MISICNMGTFVWSIVNLEHLISICNMGTFVKVLLILNAWSRYAIWELLFKVLLILNAWSRYAMWEPLRINACFLNCSNICRVWSQKDIEEKLIIWRSMLDPEIYNNKKFWLLRISNWSIEFRPLDILHYFSLEIFNS